MEGENNFASAPEHIQEKPEEEGELAMPKEEPPVEAPKKLRVFCAWCGKDLGEKESVNEGVSAGLCVECHSNLEMQVKKPGGE